MKFFIIINLPYSSRSSRVIRSLMTVCTDPYVPTEQIDSIMGAQRGWVDARSAIPAEKEGANSEILPFRHRSLFDAIALAASAMSRIVAFEMEKFDISRNRGETTT